MTARPHVLLLPGMALNATIFPALGVASRAPEFSDGPGTDGAGMAPYVAALDRLTDHAGWRGARGRVVVGHSFGGMLALAWLLAHGGRGRPPVDGLVLVSTTAGPMYRVARLRVGPVRVPTAPLLPLWNSRLVSRAAKRLLGGGGSGPVDFQRYRDRSELAIGIAGWRQTTVRGRRAYRAAMAGFDVRRALARVQVPAIVLHGTRDTYFATPVARALADGLPRAELRLVEGARHTLPLSHPEPLRRAVADVLSA